MKNEKCKTNVVRSRSFEINEKIIVRPFLLFFVMTPFFIQISQIFSSLVDMNIKLENTRYVLKYLKFDFRIFKRYTNPLIQ